MPITRLFKYPNQARPFFPSRRQISNRAASRSLTMELENRRWEEMPFDCLVNIFSKISLDNLITAVPFVCKSWYHASSDPICWKILDFRQLDFNPGSPFALSFLSQFSLSRFSFSSFLKLALARSRGAAVDLRLSSASKEDLFLVSDACPRLKNLALPLLVLEDEEQILLLVEKWKELEALEMDSKPSAMPELVKQIGLHCSKFQRLKLRGSISKEDAAAIVGFLPKLRYLDLSNCLMGREEVLNIVVGCRELRRLSAKECVGFEADDDLRRMGRDIEVFEFEGSMVEKECDYDEDEDVDENVSLEQMFMYFDDCYMMWLY